MDWFLNLKAGQKLVAAFSIIVLLLIGVIVVATYGMISVQKDYQVAIGLAEFESNNNGQRASLLSMMNAASPTELQESYNAMDAFSKANDLLLEQLPSLIQPTPENLSRLEKLRSDREEYKKARDGELVPMIRAGQTDQARKIAGSINKDRYISMRENGAALTDDAQSRANSVNRRVLVINSIAGAAAVLAAIILAFFLSRLVAIPLVEMSATAEKLAEGDLQAEISLGKTYRDEIGVLGKTFKRMTANLNQMAEVAGRIASGDLTVQVTPQSDRDILGKAFASMIESLRALTLEIRSSVNLLGTSTTQISTSTTQFTASATETATAVSETTTTVEEVRQTAQVSSDKAKQVSESAQRVARISQTGRKATEDTMDGMNKIREEMAAIAQSMISLSEQSQAIGQIVTTVEDIAAQSNLLAVNASIEAAKAGEYGRGFAIVAQEVKNLAQQSKSATAQVRIILNDIQKATSSAVMATEQGTRAVETGVVQAGHAGESIQSLSASVVEAAQAAIQIAASSQQQLVGVDQVASAMDNIKQASIQNVESSRQLDGAAHDLKDLGQKLKQLVERYKV